MRIAGITLPKEKTIYVALTYIKGIGFTSSSKILKAVKIQDSVRVKELSPEQEDAIRFYIEKNSKTEGDLIREVLMNIKRLKDIKCYRGVRHMKRLPVRGQKTKTNSRTVRGNVRKSAGSGRKPIEKK